MRECFIGILSRSYLLCQPALRVFVLHYTVSVRFIVYKVMTSGRLLADYEFVLL